MSALASIAAIGSDLVAVVKSLPAFITERIEAVAEGLRPAPPLPRFGIVEHVRARGRVAYAVVDRERDLAWSFLSEASAREAFPSIRDEEAYAAVFASESLSDLRGVTPL